MSGNMDAVVKPAKHSLGRRLDVLRVLRAADTPMSIVAIAELLDVHPNTVRFHLDILVSAGRAEQVAPERKGPGRPALMFRATRRMDPGGPRHYEILAEILATVLAGDADGAALALAAGRGWGLHRKPTGPPISAAPDAQESIEHLVGLLDELGFAPERRNDEQLGLRHCPFLELAESQKEIVCPIHLGMMQGVLENWAAPLTIDRLDPFVEPDLCLVDISQQITPT
jgi:predicted ArsR family transcriptional regulator